MCIDFRKEEKGVYESFVMITIKLTWSLCLLFLFDSQDNILNIFVLLLFAVSALLTGRSQCSNVKHDCTVLKCRMVEIKHLMEKIWCK